MEEDDWNLDGATLGSDTTNYYTDTSNYDLGNTGYDLGGSAGGSFDNTTGFDNYSGTGSSNYNLDGATLDNDTSSAWDNYFNAGDNSMTGNQSGDFSMFGGNTSGDSGTWSDGTQWGNGSNDHDGSVSNNSNYHDSDWGFAQGKDTSQFSTTGQDMSSNANSYKESTPTGDAEVGSFKDATATDNIEASKKEVGNNNADLDVDETGSRGNKNPAEASTREKVLDRIEQIESRGKANAKAGTSSASGSFQFTDKTWAATVKQAQPEWAQGMSRQEIMDARFDKDKSREMAGVLTDNNQKYLENRGIEATPGALYGAHFLGAGGASKVYGADPSTPIGQVVDRNQLAANPGVFQRNNIQTAGDFVNWSENKMNSGAGGPINSGGNSQYASLGGGGSAAPAMGMPAYSNFSGQSMAMPDSTIGGANSPMGMPAYDNFSSLNAGSMGSPSEYAGMQDPFGGYNSGTAQEAGLNDRRATDPYGFSDRNMGSMGRSEDMPFNRLQSPDGPSGNPATGNSGSRYADLGTDGAGAGNRFGNGGGNANRGGGSNAGGGNDYQGNGGGYGAGNGGGGYRGGAGGGNAQNASLGNALQQMMGGGRGQQNPIQQIISSLMGQAAGQQMNPYGMNPMQQMAMAQAAQRQQFMMQQQALQLQQRIANQYGAPKLPGQDSSRGKDSKDRDRRGGRDNYGKTPAEEAKFAALREELRKGKGKRDRNRNA